MHSQQPNGSPERARRQAGYNLVEVLVAMAVLGVILLSIVTLFFIGRRNVHSGKQLTAANAIATRVLEDLALMSATDVVDNFRLAGSTLDENSVGDVDYPDSILRDTNGAISATTNDPSGYLTRWKELIDSDTELNDGRIVLIVTPLEPRVAGEPIRTAQVLRLRGVIEWREGVRRRNVTFDASKLQRP